MIEQMYGAGKISGRNRAADQVLPTPDRPKARHPLAPEGSPGHMMPWAGRAVSRAAHTHAPAVTPEGDRR